jgi:hypothetical protein
MENAHYCSIHSDSEKPLEFVCLSGECFLRGLLCSDCRDQNHSGDAHNVLTLPQLTEETQNSRSDRSVPDSLQGCANTAREATSSCLDRLKAIRESFEKAMLEAEERVKTNLGSFESDFSGFSNNFDSNVPEEVEFDLSQGTEELNSRAIKSMEVIIKLRKVSQGLKSRAERASEAIQARQTELTEGTTRLMETISATLNDLTQPINPDKAGQQPENPDGENPQDLEEYDSVTETNSEFRNK